MTAPAWPLNVPVLGDGVVTLRAHTPADIDRMLQLAQDPEMVRWTAIPTPHDRAMSERFALEIVPAGWDEGTSMGWAIEFEGRYAGNVDIRGKDVLADIGYALHRDCRGRGVMTAAVRLAVDHAFVHAGKEAVQWRAHVGNLASLRVAWACGFRLYEPVPDLLLERGRIIEAWTGSIRFGDAPTPRTRWHAVTIEADGFVLRPTTEADLPRWAEAESSPAARHWFDQGEQSVEVIEARWRRSILAEARGTFVRWTIADAEDRYLGGVSLFGIEHGSAEVGYFLHPDATGRGIMTRAVEAAADWAFSSEGLDVHRVSLDVADGNAASMAVARRAGFVACGRRSRSEPLGDGTLADLLEYERLR